MLAIIWVAIMAVAVIQTYLLLRGSLPEVVGPLVGIGLGLLLAYGALGLEVVAGSGQVRQQPEPELAFLALSIVMTNTVFLFSDAVESLSIDSLGGAR